MFQGLLPNGSLRQIVANNTISQLIGRAISTIAMMIVSILIAKRYGPVGYGDFVKITTYVGFFYLFADYGLNAVFIKRAINTSSQLIELEWRLLFGLRLVQSAILACVAIGIMMFIPFGNDQGYTSVVRICIYLLTPVIIFQAMTTTTNAYFQKILRYDYSTMAQNAGSLIMLLIALVMSFLTALDGPMLGVLAVMGGSIATGIAALFLVRSRLPSIIPIFNLADFRTYLVSATPLGLALLFNLVYFHSDSVILTLTRPTSEVGIYGLAYKIFELPLVLPIFFMNSVYPLMLKSSRNIGGSKELFIKSFRFLLSCSLLVAVIVWITAPTMTFIRPDFAESITPLRILILGLPIFFVSALYMWYLIAQGRQRILLYIHGGAMLGNIVCNVLFVPTYGYISAAWITILSEVFVLTMSIVMTYRDKLFEKKGHI